MPVILNRWQKVCLWAGIIVFLLMGLFPPWYHTRETWTTYRYSFLFAAPSGGYGLDGQWRERFDRNRCFQLDARRLYAQWAMVAVVTGGLILTFHRQKRTD